jgi:hypothetical protein
LAAISAAVGARATFTPAGTYTVTFSAPVGASGASTTGWIANVTHSANAGVGFAGTTEGASDALAAVSVGVGATFEAVVIRLANHVAGIGAAAVAQGQAVLLAEHSAGLGLGYAIGAAAVLEALLPASVGASAIFVGETGGEGSVVLQAGLGFSLVVNIAPVVIQPPVTLGAGFRVDVERLTWRSAPLGGGTRGRTEKAKRLPALLTRRFGEESPVRPESDSTERY